MNSSLDFLKVFGFSSSTDPGSSPWKMYYVMLTRALALIESTHLLSIRKRIKDLGRQSEVLSDNRLRSVLQPLCQEECALLRISSVTVASQQGKFCTSLNPPLSKIRRNSVPMGANPCKEWG